MGGYFDHAEVALVGAIEEVRVCVEIGEFFESGVEGGTGLDRHRLSFCYYYFKSQREKRCKLCRVDQYGLQK
jgi:hypothetical protein